MKIHSGFAAAFVFISSVSLAAGTLSVTLGGKPVKEVPVDKLGSLSIKVSNGTPYKAFYKGQWGTLRHTLELGSSSNNTTQRHGSLTIENSDANKDWGSKKSTDVNAFKVLSTTGFWNYKSGDTVTLTVSYMREYYTGKNLWVEGGWVKEKAWQTAGPVLATASFKLLPPTFSKPDPAALAKEAEGVANQTGKFNREESFSHAVARDILQHTNSTQVKHNFTGSNISRYQPDGTVAFNWNYVESNNEEYVTAALPMALSIHAKNTITTGDFPQPEVVEADFACRATVEARTTVKGGGTWALSDLPLTGFKSTCKTADGKTGPDLTKNLKGPLGKVGDVLKATEGQSEEERAKALMESLGFDPGAAEPDDGLTPAQRLQNMPR